MAYPELAQLIRRRGSTISNLRELFRRLRVNDRQRISETSQFGLTKPDAIHEARLVANTIDRPFLLQQRQAIAEPKQSPTPHQKG